MSSYDCPDCGRIACVCDYCVAEIDEMEAQLRTGDDPLPSWTNNAISLAILLGMAKKAPAMISYDKDDLEGFSEALKNWYRWKANSASKPVWASTLPCLFGLLKQAKTAAR